MVRQIAALSLALLVADAAAAAEDPATALRVARELLRQGRASQARQALVDLVEASPASEVADDALLELARLDLPASEPEDLRREDAPGAAAAREVLERLVQEHPRGDRVAEARRLLGLTHLVPGAPFYDPGRAVELLLEAAEQGPRTAVGRAARRACAAAELARSRPGAALLHVEALLLDDRRGAVADRARLSAAEAYLQLGLPREAMIALSELRSPGIETSVSERALDLLMLLHRLVIPAATPYAEDPAFRPPSDLPRVASLVVDRGGSLHVLLEGDAGIRVLDSSGAVTAAEHVDGLRRLFPIPGGVGKVARRSLLVPGEIEARPTAGDRGRSLADLSAAAELPDGSFWVIDERGREALRLSPDGALRAAVEVPGRADRVVADRGGRVYVLDGKRRTVTRFGAEGEAQAVLGPRGDGYELQEPVDLAVDDALHLYVLDARAGRVLIFRDAELVAQVPANGEPLPDAGALAVDGSGAIYVYTRGDRILRRLQ